MGEGEESKGGGEEKRRPTVITVICVLGFVGAPFIAFNLITALARPTRSPFHFYYAGVVAVNLLAFVGIWRMRKWGVILYALTAAVNAVLLWQVWGYPPGGVLVGALITAVVVVIGVSQFPKMD